MFLFVGVLISLSPPSHLDFLDYLDHYFISLYRQSLSQEEESDCVDQSRIKSAFETLMQPFSCGTRQSTFEILMSQSKPLEKIISEMNLGDKMYYQKLGSYSFFKTVFLVEDAVFIQIFGFPYFPYVCERLLSIRHPFLLTPRKVYSKDSESICLYPYVSARPFEEVLPSLNISQKYRLALRLLLALEELSSYGLSHNSIYFRHILVSDEGVPFLTHFDTVCCCMEKKNDFSSDWESLILVFKMLGGEFERFILEYDPQSLCLRESEGEIQKDVRLFNLLLQEMIVDRSFFQDTFEEIESEILDIQRERLRQRMSIAELSIADQALYVLNRLLEKTTSSQFLFNCHSFATDYYLEGALSQIVHDEILDEFAQHYEPINLIECFRRKGYVLKGLIPSTLLSNHGAELFKNNISSLLECSSIPCLSSEDIKENDVLVFLGLNFLYERGICFQHSVCYRGGELLEKESPEDLFSKRSLSARMLDNRFGMLIYSPPLKKGGSGEVLEHLEALFFDQEIMKFLYVLWQDWRCVQEETFNTMSYLRKHNYLIGLKGDFRSYLQKNDSQLLSRMRAKIKPLADPHLKVDQVGDDFSSSLDDPGIFTKIKDRTVLRLKFFLRQNYDFFA